MIWRMPCIWYFSFEPSRALRPLQAEPSMGKVCVPSGEKSVDSAWIGISLLRRTC